MKMTYIASILLLTCGCATDNCLKDNVHTGEKYYFVDSGFKGSYFVFSDTSQIEYKNGEIFSESSLRWNDCSSYSMVIKNIADTSVLKAGDTIHFKLLSFERDTFYYQVKAKGTSMFSKFYHN